MDKSELNPENLQALNIGAEGEIPGCTQVNGKWVLENGECFTASRSGQVIGLEGIKSAGPLVICDADRLPFRSGAFETVYANGVPIGLETHLGPGYSWKELMRVCRRGLEGIRIDGEPIGKSFYKDMVPFNL